MATGTDSGFKPAMTAPPGQVSDFNTSDNLYKWNIVTQTVCITIPTIFMIVRSSVRFWILKKWTLEDWLCLCSWGFFIGYSSIVIKTASSGGGTHEWNETKAGAMTILYWNNVAQIVYSMSILTTKLSLLYLYLGIFAPLKYSKNWWAIVVVMIANTGFYWGLMFAKIFQCWPRDAIWDKSITTAKCVSLVGILDASGVWNTLSDVTILALPLLFIWKLKLSREKRIGITAIFAVGVIAPVFSIIGVVVRIQTSASTDLTYYQPRLLFFAEAEITSGIVCTCLPCLPRLYRSLKGERPNTVSHSAERSYLQYKNQRRRTMLRGQSNSHGDKHFLTSDRYIELEDSAYGAVKAPPRAITTDITTGSRGRGELAEGQIWKTTEITVENEPVDNTSDESHDVRRAERAMRRIV